MITWLFAMKQTTFEDYERRLLRVERLLEAHLDEPLSPASLAAAAHFSLHHFHRIFRAQRGESVMQCVRRLRLERAARTIRHADTRLLEIALAAGYESHEAFTRAFVDQFGISPSTYRQNHNAYSLQRQHPSTQPKLHVRVQHFPAVAVWSMRSYGSYANVGITWSKLLQWIQVRTSHIPPLYGICPDDPDVTEESRLRFDACVAMQGLLGDTKVDQTTIPAGTYAVGLHIGPYPRLHETYLDIIGRWFPQSGYEPAPEPVIEQYLNDPKQTPEAELETEVRVKILE